MSVYIIKSSTLNRIASVCNFFESTTPEDLKTKINTVRLENKNGHSYAIASNQKIGSVEYLGITDKPNGAVHLVLSETLKQALIIESMIESFLTITVIPEVAISSLQSNSGWALNNCCYWWDDTPLADWRNWGWEAAKKTKGAMYWNCHSVETLVKSSPSSQVIFPEFIDTDYPVVIRDWLNPNWAGVFFPKPVPPEVVKVPAQLPEWWNV